MKNQFMVISYKMKRFWLLYPAMALLIFCGALYGYEKLAFIDKYNSLYGAFIVSVSDTSFIFLLAIVSAWFMGSDFGNRTIQHEIKLGYSRMSVIFVRAVTVYALSILLHAGYVAGVMIGTGSRSKTGFSPEGFSGQDIWWCATIALQLIAFQSIIVCIAFFIRKFAAVIVISACFSFAACNVIRNFTDSGLFRVSVFCLVQDSSYETLVSADIFAVVVFIVMSALTYSVFRRADIA